MAKLFATGRVVDWILLFMLLELIALTIYRKRALSGLSPFELLIGMSAGAALLLALRAALDGTRWQGIAVWLVVALAAHLWDLGIRWDAARSK